MAERSAGADLSDDLLEHIAEGLGLEATVEITGNDEALVGTLHGEDLGLFIGRHGQTIDAVQHLAQRILLAEPGDRAPADRRRRRGVPRPAPRGAGEAGRPGRDRREQFGRPVALDAMTASERKHVHEYLRERGGVDTHSEGDEPERHLVVTPMLA